MQCGPSRPLSRHEARRALLWRPVLISMRAGAVPPERIAKLAGVSQAALNIAAGDSQTVSTSGGLRFQAKIKPGPDGPLPPGCFFQPGVGICWALRECCGEVRLLRASHCTLGRVRTGTSHQPLMGGFTPARAAACLEHRTMHAVALSALCFACMRNSQFRSGLPCG